MGIIINDFDSIPVILFIYWNNTQFLAYVCMFVNKNIFVNENLRDI